MNMEFNKCIATVSMISLILTPTILGVNAADLLSPHKQMASGIDAENVECKSGFVLMVRSTNGYAACVTLSTSEKLSTTGWGTIIKTVMTEQTSNEGDSNQEPTEQPESAEEIQDNAIEIKIKDGVGTTESP
jgi:hypothetical protein